MARHTWYGYGIGDRVTYEFPVTGQRHTGTVRHLEAANYTGPTPIGLRRDGAFNDSWVSADWPDPDTIRLFPFGEGAAQAEIPVVDRLAWPDISRVKEGEPAETRVVDPETGGEKGQKACQLGAIDSAALEELGKVAGFGAGKYERFNFMKGYAWSLSLDALLRHVLAFAGGEDLDPESGLPHTAHAAWHGLALTSFLLRGLGTDDRWKPPTTGAERLRARLGES